MRNANRAIKRPLILIVGMPGSGKTVAARVAKGMGFRVFSFGDIIRAEVLARGMKPNEENVEKVANWFHSGHERLIVRRLERALGGIRTQKPPIIEGARSPEQLKELRKKFAVRILAITLSRRTRWQRQLARKRPDIRTLADARERDRRELSYGIGKVIAQADWRLSSNCPLREFKSRCRRFFSLLT